MLTLPVLFAFFLGQDPNSAASPGAGNAAPTQASVTADPQKRSTLSGQIVSLTGEPIKKAQITLRRMDSGDMQGTQSETSDAAGLFNFVELAPGRYLLSAEKAGYVRQSFGGGGGGRGGRSSGSVITLAPGQDIKGMVMKLSPQAVITGKVVDEDGEPVAQAQVMAMQQRYFQGKRQWMPGGGGQVNDLGEYRLSGLMPGKYIIAVSAQRPFMMGRGGGARGQRPAAEESFITTYYPGVAEIAQAAAVDVAAGAEARGMDLRMLKAKTFHVSGKVVDPSGKAVASGRGGGGGGGGGGMGGPGVMLTLSPADGEFLGFLGRNMAGVRDADGDFEFPNVRPGTYVLSADRRTGPNEPRWGARVDVTVGDGNVDDLVVQMVAGSDVSGTVRQEGETSPALDNLRVMMQPQAGMRFGNTPGTVKPDGTFKLENMLPDKYTITLTGQADTYLKTIRHGNHEVKDGVLDLSGGTGGAVELILSGDGASISGTIQDAKKRPASGVTVVLVPDAARRAKFDLFKSAATDQSGTFSFKAVPPGEYKIFAWEEIDDAGWMDPAVLARYENEGRTVSLKPKAQESVNMSFIVPEGGSQIEREADEREKASAQ